MLALTSARGHAALVGLLVVVLTQQALASGVGRVIPPGARHAAYAALTQQALRHHGQELQLERLVGANFDGDTFALRMDVRHFGAPAYTKQRVRAVVRVLEPPPHPPGGHTGGAARPLKKFRLLNFADVEKPQISSKVHKFKTSSTATTRSSCLVGNGVFTPAAVWPWQQRAVHTVQLRTRWGAHHALHLPCGAALPCAAIRTTRAPAVEIEGAAARQEQWFTLLLVDPDAPDPASPRCAQWLHWMVTDIRLPAGDSGTVRVRGRTVVPFARPTPPVGEHRYVLLLLRQHAAPMAVHAPPSRCKFDALAFGRAHRMDTVPAALQWFRATACDGD